MLERTDAGDHNDSVFRSQKKNEDVIPIECFARHSNVVG